MVQEIFGRVALALIIGCAASAAAAPTASASGKDALLPRRAGPPPKGYTVGDVVAGAITVVVEQPYPVQELSPTGTEFLHCDDDPIWRFGKAHHGVSWIELVYVLAEHRDARAVVWLPAGHHGGVQVEAQKACAAFKNAGARKRYGLPAAHYDARAILQRIAVGTLDAGDAVGRVTIETAKDVHATVNRCDGIRAAYAWAEREAARRQIAVSLRDVERGTGVALAAAVTPPPALSWVAITPPDAGVAPDEAVPAGAWPPHGIVVPALMVEDAGAEPVANPAAPSALSQPAAPKESAVAPPPSTPSATSPAPASSDAGAIPDPVPIFAAAPATATASPVEAPPPAAAASAATPAPKSAAVVPAAASPAAQPVAVTPSAATEPASSPAPPAAPPAPVAQTSRRPVAPRQQRSQRELVACVRALIASEGLRGELGADGTIVYDTRAFVSRCSREGD